MRTARRRPETAAAAHADVDAPIAAAGGSSSSSFRCGCCADRRRGASTNQLQVFHRVPGDCAEKQLRLPKTSSQDKTQAVQSLESKVKEWRPNTNTSCFVNFGRRDSRASLWPCRRCHTLAEAAAVAHTVGGTAGCSSETLQMIACGWRQVPRRHMRGAMQAGCSCRRPMR